MPGASATNENDFQHFDLIILIIHFVIFVNFSRAVACGLVGNWLPRLSVQQRLKKMSLRTLDTRVAFVNNAAEATVLVWILSLTKQS